VHVGGGCEAPYDTRESVSKGARAAFAEGPVQETIDHGAFAAYSDHSGSKPKPHVKPKVTRTPGASKATPDPGPDELTLHQLHRSSWR
jgi:hypothetical protein